MSGLVLPARDDGLPDWADREAGLLVRVACSPVSRECLEVRAEDLRLDGMTRLIPHSPGTPSFQIGQEGLDDQLMEPDQRIGNRDNGATVK